MPAGGGQDGFFFLGGAHKSGTTWIMRMLNSHPQVGVVGEAGFVGFEWGAHSWFDAAAFDRWRGAKGRQLQWLRGVDEVLLRRSFQRAMIESLMRARFRKPEVCRFGDKTPYFYNVFCEDLFALFPDAWFLDVQRDGRDVVVSHLFHMLNLRYAHGAEGAEAIRRHYIEGEGPAVPLFTPASLEGLLGRWVAVMEGGRRARELFGARYLRVRYEDVLADPHREVRRMLRHLEVKDGDYIVGHCVDQHTFEKASGRDRGAEDRGSFFRKGVAGDWANYFTDADKALFKERAGALLVEAGYEADEDW